MNNKIKSIVKFNLYKNIQNKWFIILNVFMLISIVIAINFNEFKNIINIDNNKEKFNINIYDDSNLLYSKLNESLNNNDKLKDKISLSIIEDSNKLNELQNNLNKDNVIIEITNNFDNIKVISKEGIDNKYYQFIYDNIKIVKNEVFAIKHNISINDLNEILKEPNIERVMLNVNSKDSNLKTFLNQASNYVIFLILMIVLSKIANDISQEKMSKSIEYVLTSINEKDYLISKVISINLLVIIQMVFAFVYYVIANSINRIININTLSNLNNALKFNMDTTIIIYIIASIVLSILTIIILTTIQAAISSKTTNVSEASNATFLLVMINMAVYFIASFLITPLKTPNIITYIVSCIPIVSMYFIPSMIIVGNYNLLIVPISIIINIIAVPYVFKVCSKIFKKGILNSTNNKKKKDVDENIEEKIKKENIKSEYKNIAFVTSMSIILYVVLNNLFVLLFGVISPKITFIETTTVNLIVQSVTFALSLYIPSRFVNMYNSKEINKDKKKFKIKDVIKDLSICFSLVLIIQFVLEYIFNKLGINNDLIKDLNLYNFSNNFDKVLFFIQIAVLPAIFEELFFRKELLNLSKKISIKFGIIFTAIVFALMHLNLSQSIFAFIMGIMLAYMAIKYDSIKISSLIHLFNNGTVALLLIFEKNVIVSRIMYVLIFLIFIYGIVNIIIAIKNILKNKKIKNINLKVNRDLKYLFYDYTFDITLIFIIILFILTEFILNKI